LAGDIGDHGNHKREITWFDHCVFILFHSRRWGSRSERFERWYKYLCKRYEGRDSPLKMLRTEEMGPVSNMKIIPREKICTPEPEK